MLNEERILLAYGSGGKMSHQLTQQLFLPCFDNAFLRSLDDAAIMEVPAGRLALTTDSFVVKPLFFPGGDIGKLAVCGTVNDLAMKGAKPLYLTASFIIEEGLRLADLRRVVESMARMAKEVGVQIVAGDTKVVEKGQADSLYINTAGVGFVPPGLDLSGANPRPGDVVILSGAIGDHGIAVLSQREGLGFETSIASDCAPLHGLVEAILSVSREVRALRDPSRGGLATTLNEFALQAGVAIRVEEEAIPVHEGVRAACEMLGYDPLYIANEGKLVAIVPAETAEEILARLRAERYGEEAAIIGTVLPGPAGRVTMRTRIGGTRIVDMLTGEMLPRIC
jgi:hydrogenase expression/formation protein HypE